jgi:hypothetical protein
MVRSFEPPTVKKDTVPVRWARRQQRRRPSADDRREKYIFVIGYGAVGETPAEAAAQCEEIEDRNKKAHHNRYDNPCTRKNMLW